MSSSTPTPCLICYNMVTCGNASLSLKFTRLLHRFCGQDFNCDPLNWKWVCCESCADWVTSFCTVYDQVKNLELELEWRLGNLVEIMKEASKVPSRLDTLHDNILEPLMKGGSTLGAGLRASNEILNGLQTFRGNLIEEASNKLQSSYPRVLVKRMELPMSRKNSEAIIKVEVKQENIAEHLCWISTFTAVVLLALLGCELQSQDPDDTTKQLKLDLSTQVQENQDDLHVDTSVGNFSTRIQESVSKKRKTVKGYGDLDVRSSLKANRSDKILKTGAKLLPPHEQGEASKAVKLAPDFQHKEKTIGELLGKLNRNKRFQNPKKTKAHTTNKKRHQCKRCKRSFPSYKKLRGHKLQNECQLMRSIDKKKVLTPCEKPKWQKKHQQTSKNIKSSEVANNDGSGNSFKCTECNKMSRMMSWKGKCPVCYKTLAAKKRLKQFLKRRTSQKPFVNAEKRE